jgi:hypothetical protein
MQRIGLPLVGLVGLLSTVALDAFKAAVNPLCLVAEVMRFAVDFLLPFPACVRRQRKVGRWAIDREVCNSPGLRFAIVAFASRLSDHGGTS